MSNTRRAEIPAHLAAAALAEVLTPQPVTGPVACPHCAIEACSLVGWETQNPPAEDPPFEPIEAALASPQADPAMVLAWAELDEAKREEVRALRKAGYEQQIAQLHEARAAGVRFIAGFKCAQGHSWRHAFVQRPGEVALWVYWDEAGNVLDYRALAQSQARHAATAPLHVPGRQL